MQKSNKTKNPMVKIWLITGGNGFLGANLREEVAKKHPKHRIVVVDTRNYNKRFVDGAKISRISVTNSRSMEKLFNKYRPDYVVHLAAVTKPRESMRNPKRCIEQNMLGALNVLDLSRKFGSKVILASSCGVTGEHFSSVDEATYANPLNPYATSKLCVEQLSDCYIKLGLGACNLRFSNIFGPWSDHKPNAIPTFIKAFINKRPMKINGNGLQTRNFIYVKDAVRAILTAVVKNATGTYCIANNRSISINDVVSVICDAGGNNAEIEFGDFVDGEIVDINVDSSKARKDLGFQCEYSMIDGMKKTLKWFRRLSSGTL
jgi:UDP-glucose 4-epimerase